MDVKSLLCCRNGFLSMNTIGFSFSPLSITSTLPFVLGSNSQSFWVKDLRKCCCPSDCNLTQCYTTHKLGSCLADPLRGCNPKEEETKLFGILQNWLCHGFPTFSPQQKLGKEEEGFCGKC